MKVIRLVYYMLFFSGIMLGLPIQIYAQETVQESGPKRTIIRKRSHHTDRCCKWADNRQNCHDFTQDFFGTLFYDLVKLNVNLFTWDSFRIFAGVFPAYIGARMIDEDLQCHFFSHRNHKNKNQFPQWCHDAVKYGVGIPIAVLGVGSLFSSNQELRTTGWVYALGFPFVIFGKDILKKAEADCCLRPWHENFCQNHKRSLGGFPSGHMAEVAYTAVLYGVRFGPKAAIPLGIYAGALGIVFLNCNRHYLSQFIGGIGLGAMYALAANKLIDEKLSGSYHTCFTTNYKGDPALQVSWQF